MYTTLKQIRECSPCESGWRRLLTHLGKTKTDDEPLSIITIIDSNGLDDALWCLRAVKGYDREKRLYAVRCARAVQHLMTDQRSIDALDVAERFANGKATEQELNAAGAVAALDAWNAAWNAAWAATGDTGNAGDAWDAERDAQEKDLREMCAAIAPSWGEDCVCKDDVYTNNGDDDSFGMPIYLADKVSALIQRNSELEALLVKIDRKAESGLCAGTFAGSREFFKDIREVLSQHHD